MRIRLIDYSHIFYSSGTARPLPPKRSGKFIQARHGDDEYIIMAPAELCVYHANIAGRFFEESGVDGAFNPKRDVFSLTDTEWEITGGGFWEVDDGIRLLRLYGRSQAYGRFDASGLADRLGGLDELASHRISID